MPSAIDISTFPPAHPVYETQVAVPTIRRRQKGLGLPDCPPEFEGREEIVVQWFGESESGELKDLQFAFPILSDPDAMQWFGHPEWFRVIMLGPLKNWPNPRGLEMFLQQGLSLDSLVLYVITSQIGLDDGRGGVRPAAYLVNVVLLGDPLYGVITPREYADWDVSKEEIAKLSRLHG